MFSQIKHNAFLIVGAFFLWQGWSGAQATASSAESQDELHMPEIQVSYLREGANEEATYAATNPPRDPFGLAKLRRAQEEQERVMAELNVSVDSDSFTEIDPVARTPFSLVLQSTMNAGGVWVARINGHNLHIGDQLPNFQEGGSAVLVAVVGRTAQVLHNGELVLLDLDGVASVSVQ